MNTKTVKIGNRDIVIKEILFEDSLGLEELKDNKEKIKKLIELATDLNEESRKALTMREGFELIKEINELNGLTEDFLLKIQSK